MNTVRARVPAVVWPRAGSLGFVALAVILAAVAGAAVSWRPAAVIALAALAAWILAIGDAARVERTTTFALLGGAVVLGYGFANLGFRGSLPVPLGDVVLVSLAFAAAVGRPEWRPPLRYVFPLAAFVVLVAVRLAFDVPVWHSLAVRDSTTAVEAVAVFVGYRAVCRDGIQMWVRRLEVIFVAVLAYASLTPWQGWLSAHSPTVGLQRPVSLLGEGTIGSDVSIVAALVFFALYAKGTRRIVLIAWAIAEIGLVQSRGLYIALALALIVVGWGVRNLAGTWLRALAALAVAVIVLALLAGTGISGRLGRLSPDFYLAHVSTLAGDQGPGASSFSDRLTWTSKAVHLMRESTATTLIGVGLGPDLAFGFQTTGGAEVRKPHDDYVEVLARTGVVGLGIFSLMLWSLVSPIARRARRGQDQTGRFCTFVFAATAAYLAVAATQPLLAFSYGTIPVFMWLGMGLAAVVGPSPGSRPDHVRSWGV